MSSDKSNTKKNDNVLVLGATGATGRHLMQQLLQKNYNVTAIVRSKQRLLDVLVGTTEEENKLLSITEAATTDMTDEQVMTVVQSVDTIVSCLGHTLDMKGLFGRPCYWVSDTARRFVEAAADSEKKFIWMNSDGVAHPDDNVRPFFERAVIFLLRHFINPHKDNELAADYFYKLHASSSSSKDSTSNIEWIVVRPTDLIDGDATVYQTYEKPQGSLFGSGTCRRANVAKFMTDLIQDDSLWNQYKYTMPVLHDGKKVTSGET